MNSGGTGGQMGMGSGGEGGNMGTYAPPPPGYPGTMGSAPQSFTNPGNSYGPGAVNGTYTPGQNTPASGQGGSTTR
jgi:hypothetical protein